MTFEDIIGQVINSVNSQKNILTDGQLTCSYQEMPTFFESIDKYFAESEISVENNLAFECVNSVPSALTLLYLLKKGYNFVLLPPLCNRGKELSFKLLIPKFCQYQVTIENYSNNETVEPDKYPEKFLRIEKREQYHYNMDMESNGGGKLYLKTSGSTGASKIAVHSHTKLLGNVLNCVKRFGLEGDDRITIPVPIFHMYGLGAAFLPSIMVGASIDLQENSNIIRYMGRERQFNQNVAFLTPTLCEMLLKGLKTSRVYKRVVTAGDRIKENIFLTFESRFGNLLNLYGSTEMGAIATSVPDDPIEVRAIIAGKPMSGVQMRVNEKTSETGENITTGVGELCCKHEYGFEGYVEESGNKISQDVPSQSDWFKTGDLGKIRPDGYIEVLGRCDHSVNRSGFLVLFSDIEKAMETIDCIERVVVMARGESKRGQKIVAFCVPTQGTTPSDTQIRTACFDILPKYAIPDHVFVVNSLPTLPNGKVDRPVLVEMASDVHQAR